jgi:hypothetical protein
MYSLIWQSVTWRPGKLRFLIGVKNPLPIRPTAIARKHGPLRGRAVRQIRTSVGLCPPFVAHPATVSHPDRRALLISSVAQQAIARVLAGIRRTYGTSTGLAPVPLQSGSAMSAV